MRKYRFLSISVFIGSFFALAAPTFAACKSCPDNKRNCTVCTTDCFSVDVQLKYQDRIRNMPRLIVGPWIEKNGKKKIWVWNSRTVDRSLREEVVLCLKRGVRYFIQIANGDPGFLGTSFQRARGRDETIVFRFNRKKNEFQVGYTIEKATRQFDESGNAPLSGCAC